MVCSVCCLHLLGSIVLLQRVTLLVTVLDDTLEYIQKADSS